MSEQETMEAWMKLATPGKEHEMIARYAGDWNVIMRSWMSPNDPPNESKGTTRAKMALGGRVLMDEFKGDFMGMPFEGHGMLGYNNYRNRWWQTWNDNMGTGIYHAEGTASPDGKTVTLIGKSDNPMQDRKDVEMKGVYRFLNDKEFTYEMHTKGPDGKEFKTMEIIYRRK